MKVKVIYLAMCLSLMFAAVSCDKENGVPKDSGMLIMTGGVNADELVASSYQTKATNAEDIPWLAEPLRDGISIEYGLTTNKSETRTAVLKLIPADDCAERTTALEKYGNDAVYSFFYKDETPLSPAYWFGNGSHFFQGLNIPEKIVTGNDSYPSDLVSNQTDLSGSDNYTVLSRYLSTPADCEIPATVSVIKIPFKHRLSKVIAYILIDPSLTKQGVTLKGYNTGSDDPSTTALKFENVQVLESVGASNHPVWTTARKVTPHFIEERGAYNHETEQPMLEGGNQIPFYMYVDAEDEHIYPSHQQWATIHAAYTTRYNTAFANAKGQGKSDAEADALANDAAAAATKYTRIDYGTNVPCYDIIVRPTYDPRHEVMFDEESSTDPGTNSIDFTLTLSNDLEYVKHFEFDLDANSQTVIYLRISMESVDYNSSGSEAWMTTNSSLDWYGVDNTDGQTLSPAGSSWQRAYRVTNNSENVYDGDKYQGDGTNGQYVSVAKWIEYLAQAYKGDPSGSKHGSYFILESDIALSSDQAAALNAITFTGHLDCLDHTITLPAGSTYLFGGLDGTYTVSAAGEANVHSDKNPAPGFRAEILNTKVDGGSIIAPGGTLSGNIYNCFQRPVGEAGWSAVSNKPALPQY